MSALKDKILRLIRAQGPISVSQYMQIALGDPVSGYYMRADPIGRDFITAPEVSQIFGELIGLFFVQAWEDRGRPEKFHLVELGPGRGTLMADMLRVAKIRPAFLEAAQISLVETSPALRAVQQKTLAGTRVEWRSHFGDVPKDAPLFLVANEFFDALPARQFVRAERGWHERMITANGDTLAFALAPGVVPSEAIPAELRDSPLGAVYESSPASQAVITEITQRLLEQDGLALIVDYGHSQSGAGDTFQAVKASLYADPLAEPGDADLTFHVDFAALSRLAVDSAGQVFGPTPQGSFLSLLGIEARAEQLKRAAPAQAEQIDQAVDRLINPNAMGILFKVMAVSDGRFRHPDGFACSS